MYKKPLFKWYDSRLSLSAVNRKSLEKSSNFIILFILGHLEKDRWRKVFWAYLQNFDLPFLKLNEVRDFKIHAEEELLKISKSAIFGFDFFTGWVNIYKELGLDKPLITYMKDVDPLKININNVEVLLPYFDHLTSLQKKKVLFIVQHTSDIGFTTFNSTILEEILYDQ